MDQHHTQPAAPPKPLVFAKMESLVREMQDPETGVPIRSQKWFLTSIPSSFMGYDLIEWLMERLEIEDSAEAIHLANLLCQYGYFFPVGESRSLIVKDDSSLYRFQTPYYWPSQNHSADTTDYAIYLTKRLSRNKQKHGLEEYELEAYNKLKRTLSHKWDFITMQAEEQVKLAKDRKKGDKIVTDSQERAYWRVYRPPPGFTNCLEIAPVPDKTNMANRVRKKTVDDLKKDNEFLATAVGRTRQKVSQAGESLLTHYVTYLEYDPILVLPQPSNPWISEELSYWTLNEPKVDIPTEKRVRRWQVNLEELINDPLGQSEFTNYLRKEYCHENIRFWQAVNQLRSGPASNVPEKVQSIFEEFLQPGAPCEINIDGKTMEITQKLMKKPTRYTYDLASEHVYVLLLKKDCYPRFLRSEQYKMMLSSAIQPSQKKRFFKIERPGKKKTSTTSAPNNITLGQTPQPLKRHGSDEHTAGLGGGPAGDGAGYGIHTGPSGNKLECEPPYSASEKYSSVPVDVSQSNTICPWETNTETSPNVCPWETATPPPSLQTQQSVELRVTQAKSRPDRSKSVDVSSLSKRHGSVSVAPSLVPVLTEGQPTTSICPWENQVLPNRTTEKSKSIDVDICPWETNEPVKKASTSSAPGIVTSDTSSTQSSIAIQEKADKIEKQAMVTVGSAASREKGSKDRPPCERKISIQVCPWDEVDEETKGSQSTASEQPQAQGRRASKTLEKPVEQATKPKEKVTSCTVESQANPESLGVQMTLELRQRSGSEGTPSPSSTCSSSSHGDSRRIRIDYTVRSGHLPGQYGLPIAPATNTPAQSQPSAHGPTATGGTTTVSTPHRPSISGSSSTMHRPSISGSGSTPHRPSISGSSSTTHRPSISGSGSTSHRPSISGSSSATHRPSMSGSITTTSAAHRSSVSGNTSTTSTTHRPSVVSSSGSTAAHHTTTTTHQPAAPSESPRSPGTLSCPEEGGSKPTSPRVASNVKAPWEEKPKQKTTDVCPWEDEESCKVDTPFVKTYATLGYL